MTATLHDRTVNLTVAEPIEYGFTAKEIATLALIKLRQGRAWKDRKVKTPEGKIFEDVCGWGMYEV